MRPVHEHLWYAALEFDSMVFSTWDVQEEVRGWVDRTIRRVTAEGIEQNHRLVLRQVSCVEVECDLAIHGRGQRGWR